MDTAFMPTTDTDTISIQRSEDVVVVRQVVRQRAVELGFSLVDQTKLVTAASELARNTLQYGGGGAASVERVTAGARRGVRVTFEDEGPGIPDLAAAMRDGFTTGTGLGLGLSGAKRLSNDFEIQSAPGAGTRVVITRWK
jgi:serine/threonine-protein kinase RsbT